MGDQLLLMIGKHVENFSAHRAIFPLFTMGFGQISETITTSWPYERITVLTIFRACWIFFNGTGLFKNRNEIITRIICI